MLLKVKVEQFKSLLKLQGTYNILSLMVQINVALREVICQKIGSERVNVW